MKKLFIIIFLLFSANFIVAQTDTLKVKTSALCDMCQKTIEHDLSFVKGVKSASVDLEQNIVTVIYLADKVSPEKIRMAITKSGYDADSLKANPNVYKRLPDCCRKNAE